MIADGLFLMALAIILDAIIGDPQWLYRKIPHPVVIIGGGIKLLERYLNIPKHSYNLRRSLGCLAIICLVSVAGISAFLIHILLQKVPFGILGEALLASTLIAQRSLYDHVRDVAVALRDQGLNAGRSAVSRIVGRDVHLLDEAGVRRGAIESLAENLSDGVVAPIFWGCIFGLPGIAAYKAINTADSMIGHKTDRYKAFGWAAARLDDVANWIPARLTGILLTVVSGQRWHLALRVMLRDASRHRSPNAGWPEAAMAGALSVRLSGPRRYAEGFTSEPWLNEGAADPTDIDLWQALRLMIFVCVAVFGLVGVLSFSL